MKSTAGKAVDSDAIARSNWPQYNDLTSVYAFCDTLVKKDTEIERLKEVLESNRAFASTCEQQLNKALEHYEHTAIALAEQLTNKVRALNRAERELAALRQKLEK